MILLLRMFSHDRKRSYICKNIKQKRTEYDKYGVIIIFGINEHNNFVEQDVYDVNDLQRLITSLGTDSLVPKIRTEFLAITYKVFK